MTKPNSLPEDTLFLQTLNVRKILDSPREERFDRVTRLAQRLLDVPVALFSLVDEDQIWFKSKQGLEISQVLRPGALCDVALQIGDILLVEDAARDERFRDTSAVTGELGVRFYAGCPVRDQSGSFIGTLCVLDTVPRRIGPDDIEILRDLGLMIEDAISTLAQATTDELTGLANRRGFLMIAEPMVALCRRAWNPAAALLFDLDGLKSINDQFGHNAGDRAIRDFAKMLLKVFRNSDVVARVGGDEFCVLLTDPEELNSESPLDRLQQRIDNYNTNVEAPLQLRFSSGVTRFSKKRHTTLEDLLREADSRMYAEKRAK